MRLVADANVLFSALAEVQECAAQLAIKKALSLDVVLMAVASLPVGVVEQRTHEKKIPEPRRRIGRRDPDDVEILALVLHTGFPLWSNDNDFEDAGVEWFTTAELLARLK